MAPPYNEDSMQCQSSLKSGRKWMTTKRGSILCPIVQCYQKYKSLQEATPSAMLQAKPTPQGKKQSWEMMRKVQRKLKIQYERDCDFILKNRVGWEKVNTIRLQQSFETSKQAKSRVAKQGIKKGNKEHLKRILIFTKQHLKKPQPGQMTKCQLVSAGRTVWPNMPKSRSGYQGILGCEWNHSSQVSTIKSEKKTSKLPRGEI